MSIVILGKPACPKCDQAKRTCEITKNEYKYKQLGTDFDLEEYQAKVPPGVRTFPAVFINDEYIGSYDELVKELV